MKPKHLKEQKAKEVRNIQKRQREICKEIRNLGYIQLEKPIRHGWFKEIVITQNIDRYKNKDSILEIYKIIEKSFWGSTKEKADKKWLQQTSKHLIYKEFPTISKKQFNRLSYKAQKMCTSFQYRNERRVLKLRFYIRIPKGSYRIKYTRAYITHSKRIDPLLESEYALLEQQLLKKEYYKTYQKLYGWKGFYYWNNIEFRKQKRKAKKQLKTLKKYPIEDVLKDNISWEKN